METTYYPVASGTAVSKFSQQNQVTDFMYLYIYMYLCCVESLRGFRSKLDFLQILKVAPKSGQSPCTIVHGLGPNFMKNEKESILHFYYIF